MNANQDKLSKTIELPSRPPKKVFQRRFWENVALWVFAVFMIGFVSYLALATCGFILLVTD